MLDEIVQAQAGMISRAQVLQCGLTDDAVTANIVAGRWQRVVRGVYACTNGQITRLGLLWAVVLRMGSGATLSHTTAAELHGLAEPARPIHVTVPTNRQPTLINGVVVHRSIRLPAARHPTRTPPQTTVEETVVDLTQSATTVDDATAWIARAVGARLTTVQRIADAMADRSKLRWRRGLAAALRDVSAGCHSLLELLYLRDVERAHGLPRGERQVRRLGESGPRYEDVLYRAYDTVVELDGRAAHPDRFRDMRRDNHAVVAGRAPLRYGYGDVREQPCATAVQVGTVLSGRGWRGRLRRCRRPHCIVL